MPTVHRLSSVFISLFLVDICEIIIRLMKNIKAIIFLSILGYPVFVQSNEIEKLNLCAASWKFGELDLIRNPQCFKQKEKYSLKEQKVYFMTSVRGKGEGLSIHIDPFKSADENFSIVPEVRFLKAWYQDANAGKSVWHKGGDIKIYELLVRDDSLITSEGKNHIKVLENNGEKYIATEGLRARPWDQGQRKKHEEVPFEIIDNPSKKLNPISDETYIYILLDIPSEIPVKNLSSRVYLKNQSDQVIDTIDLSVDVLDVILENSPLTHGIYYRGYLAENGSISSENKDLTQLRCEMLDMKAHGISDITIYQWNNEEYFHEYFSLKKELFGTGKKEYFLGGNIPNLFAENNIKKIKQAAEKYKHLIRSEGTRIMLYAADEARSELLNRQSNAWKELIAEGYGIIAADKYDEILNSDWLADEYIVAYEPLPEIAEAMHARNKKVYSYANPQTSVEAPISYRGNYGLNLYLAGYDGSFLYAYQDTRGSAWSDNDGGYRDHSLTYPTSDCVVPTLSWEAYREGVYDIRYVVTLRKILQKNTDNGISTEAKNYIKSLDREAKDYDQIRRNLYEYIKALKDS